MQRFPPPPALGLCIFCPPAFFVAASTAASGVDLDTLYLSQPDSGEQALEIADIMVSTLPAWH